jgi:C1A family cysteine protease
MAKKFKNNTNLIQPKRKYAYGWVPSKTGRKIEHFFLPAITLEQLPSSVDMEPLCPPVYDQGQLGSCTANAGAGLAHFLMLKGKLGDFVPCRLALYWWNRLQEHTTTEDSGASLQDAIITISKYGVPHESLWPYTDQGDEFTHKPAKAVWSDGYWHMIAQGLSVSQDLNHIKSCLAQGYPVIFGFTVYESFESDTVAQTGIMPMPKADEQVLGGHAVMAVGYDDTTGYVKVRNSWGSSWGKNGYFYMPYKFITDPNQASDFWTAHSYSRFKDKH